MALNQAKVITVTSVKGGTGKSTTVLNMAGILSNNKKKTVIVDLDLYSGVIAATLNLEVKKDIYSFALDLINNKFKRVEDYTFSYNEYIDVISCPLDPRSVSRINSKAIEIMISRLKLQYDYILIDTNHVIDHLNLTVMDLSNKVFYIMTNDLMDIKNMKTMTSIFKDMGVKNHKIILNTARPNNTSYTVYDIENIIENKVDYVIPKSFYNKSIEKYVYDGKIMTLEKQYKNSQGDKILQQILE